VFIQVSPFQSLTGANADRWIGCRPGTEAAVIMGLIRTVTGERKWSKGKPESRKALAELTEAYTPEAVARMSGVSAEDQAAWPAVAGSQAPPGSGHGRRQ
jgi:anaerobic selenocysteine-containing dehydrogenase